MYKVDYNPYLMHFGIKGMKWGVRRYQNPDGSLTAEGRKRYYNSDGSLTKAGEKWKNSTKSSSSSKKSSSKSSNKNKRNRNYTSLNREADKEAFGSRGVKRINKRMNKGDSYTKAVAKEIIGGTLKSKALGTAGIAGYYLYSIGPSGRQAIKNSIGKYAQNAVKDFVNYANSKNAQRAAKEAIPKLYDAVIELKPWEYKVR